MQCPWRNDQDTSGPILLRRAALKRALTEARDAHDDLLDFVLMPWHNPLRAQHILMNRTRLRVYHMAPPPQGSAHSHEPKASVSQGFRRPLRQTFALLL